MPTLVQSYKVEDAASGTTPLVTGAFTPASGELLVVKISCSDANQTIGTLAVTGFTTVAAFASRVNVGTSGTTTRCAIFTAFVNASASGTVSSGTFVNTRERAMVVERWSNAQLAATPATASFVGDAVSPWQTTITTAANGSVVSQVLSDWVPVDPATRAYTGDTATPTEEQTPTYFAGTMTAYWLHQAAASAGSQTWGLSAPAGMTLTGAAIEIQDAGGGSQDANIILSSPRTDVTLHP